jgi:hypothetical protein
MDSDLLGMKAMKTQLGSIVVGVFERHAHARKPLIATRRARFSLMHACIGTLVVSLSSVIAMAGEPPAKPKAVAKSAVSTKRQAKLDAIHAKRKALALRKHSGVADPLGSPASLKASSRDTEAKIIPNRAAATTAEQSAANQLQLLQQRPITTAEQTLWNQQPQILLMELSRQGMMPFGPNGAILPGDGLPAFQNPSFGGLQIPSFGGLQFPSFGGLQIPRR